MSTAGVELWLPALDRFEPAHPLHGLLARADRLDAAPALRLARMGEAFADTGSPLPVAALIRERLRGDAGTAAWLCADPAWVQPDMTGVRLLGCGTLELAADEAQAYIDVLQPAFADAGLRLEAGAPTRWQARCPADASLPAFDTPEQALGEDLAGHLPPGAAGRPWRALLNETQVLLHRHPLNQSRQRRGLPPINSVWLWGAGRLPARLRTVHASVVANDDLLLALAACAGIPATARTAETVAAAQAGCLVDWQDVPASGIAWPVLQALAQRLPVRLVFAGGERWLSRPWHRWRRWRKAPR